MRMGRVLALVAGALVFFIAAARSRGLRHPRRGQPAGRQPAGRALHEGGDARAAERRHRRPARRRAVRVGSRAARRSRARSRAAISRAARPRVDRDRHRRRRRPADLPQGRRGRAVRRLPRVRARSRASSGRSRVARAARRFDGPRPRDPAPGPAASACGAPCAPAFWARVFLRALAFACFWCLCGPSSRRRRAGELGLRDRAARRRAG